MSPPLDDRYFEWLYRHIGAVRNRNPARSHWHLARQLYTKEFVWFVSNDDNRVGDGKDLRRVFLDEQQTDEVDPAWMDLGCSMLEMLVALSRRASYESDKAPGDWFWEMMTNIDVKHYTDDHYTSVAAERIDEALDAVIFRTYDYSGVGGLFPLKNASTDQRDVELWYQLAGYLLETDEGDYGAS